MVKMLRFPLFLLLSWSIVGCVALGSTPISAASPARPSSASPTVPQARDPTPSLYPAPLATIPSSPTFLPPSPTPPESWSTYTNPAWQLAIDVPGLWSVSQEPAGLAFISPGGETIWLAQVDLAGLAPEAYLSETLLPNQRCTSGENPAGIQTFTCLDTLTRSTTAYFIVTTLQGQPRLLSLSTTRPSSLQVLDAMLASIRPSP